MGQIERAARRDAKKKDPSSNITDMASTASASVDFSKLRNVQLQPKTLDRNRVIATSKHSAANEAYKMLRTRIKQSMQSKNLTTLAISSTMAGQGKTLTAINLAFSLARDTTLEIVLVDFDLRHPSIFRTLGINSKLPGLVNYLNHKSSLQDLLISPGSERLAILGKSRVFEDSSEILSSPRTQELLAELQSESSSRIVIFDLPPLLSTDDCLAFTPWIDAVLLVVAEGKTRRTELAEAYDMLQGINIIGTVLNQSSSRGERYAYYY